MPADQDKDADWGIMLENDDDVDRFKKALREIDEFLAGQDFPRRGFVSYQVSNFTDQSNGHQEAWIMSLAPSPVKAKKDSTATKSSSFFQSTAKTQGDCFGECPGEELFMNSKLDVVVCKPAPGNTHDNIICHATRPQEFKRSDMLPLTECQFHGGAWPCANQPQIMVETYYNDSSLRRHYDEEWEPNGTSLECLRDNGWPSFLVCPDARTKKEHLSNTWEQHELGKKCDRLPQEVSRPYVRGSMPTSEMQELVGL